MSYDTQGAMAVAGSCCVPMTMLAQLWQYLMG